MGSSRKSYVLTSLWEDEIDMIKKRILPGILSAVLSWVFVPNALSAPIHVGVSYQLLPLGDSITRGDSHGGYRPWLQQMLADGDYITDFVGPLTEGSDYMTDKEHAGYGGYRIDQVDAQLNSIMGTGSGVNPNLILMMLGTNDVYENYDLANAPSRLAAMIGNIYALAPDTHLLLSTIPELYPGPGNSLDPVVDWSGRVQYFNSSLPSIVNTYAGAGRNIALVDLHGVLGPSDYDDGIHPDPQGYYNLAQGWYSGVQSITLPTPLPASLPMLIGGVVTLAGFFIRKGRKSCDIHQ